MTIPHTNAVLHQPISELELSDVFKAATKILGYNTITELLANRSDELAAQPGFTMAFVYEYVNFLELRGLGALVDP